MSVSLKTLMAYLLLVSRSHLKALAQQAREDEDKRRSLERGESPPMSQLGTLMNKVFTPQINCFVEN